ncbi:MAG: hypothetical protein JSV09_04350 [Thermoplasmata archaeon]|nr:MAG: hypothetical protein JSV09_04350 [Thermoplasmata archaeon]
MIGMMELCILSIVLIVIVLFLLIILAIQKIKGGELPEGDVNLLIPQFAFHMQYRGWRPKVDPIRGKITVEKDSLIATDIYFQQQPDGRIDILHGVNAGVIGWVLVIVLVLTTSLGGLIFAIILHVLSRKFAKEEVIPLIMHYSMYPSQPHPPLYPVHSQKPL